MKSFVALTALAALALPCLADQVRLDHPGDNLRNPSFSGGAFRATTVSGNNGMNGGFGGDASSFLTFCLERNEYFSLGNTYYTTIDVAARDGGVAGGSPDPLSPVTAALYLEFRNTGSFGAMAALGNGLLDTGNETRSLQRAIWHSEDELDGSEYSNDPLAVALYNWAVANNTGSIGNVRVLNVWGNSGHTQYQQDMLTLVPLPPAAWAGITALGGVIGLGYIRKRGHNS
jgi:hypothetical protein